MTDTTRGEGLETPACSTCSSIPDDLLVNTGRDGTFPAEVDRLLRLELGTRNDLYRCPACGALFEWEDLPQYYGSGNNDEERLTRLSPTQAATARALLDPEPGERDGPSTEPGGESLCERAFRTLPPGVLYEVLRHVGREHPHVFVGLLEPLVARLAVRGDHSLCDVITSYCGLHGDRLEELRRVLEAPRSGTSGSVDYLRETCAKRIAEVERYRPKLSGS